MRKWFFFVSFCFFCAALHAQDEAMQLTKRVPFSKDSIRLEAVSINPSLFKVFCGDVKVDSVFFNIDFAKATLIFNDKMPFCKDSLTVSYLKYPSFLTKVYQIFDDKKIISDGAAQSKLYRIEPVNTKKVVPFDGLNTSGSITRGITIGNNQNTVVNSALDLQITGKISNKISLRASIQDTNIPLQQGGYSQRLDEFDQIFIELFSDKWAVRAGDLFLENRQSRFLNFNKKVQGISANFKWGSPQNETSIFTTAALVRGQYAKSNFVGQEGNQGPYKLLGQNGELFVLVVSGSERVFVNGILLKRGENNDYMIDYNAGEIRFTSLFPITSEMRIVIEYQFSDQNFTRFVTYGGATHVSKKWHLGGYLYNENDRKNQPLQQTLTPEQVTNLVDAGDDLSLMTAPSAFVDSFSANKILYKKIQINGTDVFEYSTNATDVLYSVRFTNVGANKGNYKLTNGNAVGRIYQYVAAVNGVLQGSFEPIIRLIAPTQIQVATVLGGFKPSEKTNFDFEFGVSNNDKNLFSNKDDSDNAGFAGKLNFKQNVLSRKTKVDVSGGYQFVQQQFSPIERLFSIEFNRDWNLTTTTGSQSLFQTGVLVVLPNKGTVNYNLEMLRFSESFSGNRHLLSTNLFSKNWKFLSNSSYLNSDGNLSKSLFLRHQSAAIVGIKKNWIGVKLRLENNQETIKASNQFSGQTQKFTEYGAFVGRGDSTKVFVEVGYLKRVNDSLQNGFLKRVNQSDAVFLKSRLIQTEKSNLSVFVNYRNLTFEDHSRKNIPSLNSRILYNDRFFKQLVQTNVAYETTSGTIAQQEFTYLEVDSGSGIYTWKDYNNNGIQELEEFEVAQFADQAKFIRVFLPNQVFINTHQNKFSQALVLNPNIWQNKTGFKKFLSHFYNQSSFLTERKIARDAENFDLNPFSGETKNLLGLVTNFRNSLFFNRGQQMHSVTYTFLVGNTKNLLSVGSQETRNSSHQLQYQHLLVKTWLFTLENKLSKSATFSENYASRNFEIDAVGLQPKISYLFSRSASLDLFYDYQNKKNNIGTLDQLTQQKLGLSFLVSGQKQFTINGEFTLVSNKFFGNELSPVAFQMLEGLQTGQNLTWRLLLQKKLTNFLDVNINYQGRKGDNSTAIQTGNIQLRAFF
jgi:hypothetical protein